MKTFRFRGARILEWRRVQADAARVVFVRATASEREAAARVADADAAIDRAAGEYLGALRASADVGTIVRYRNWIGRQRSEAITCRQMQQERRAAAEAAANELQVANRHVKVMERLRERAMRRYLDEERRQDMKDLDQLATQQFARRMTEGADREY